MQKYEFRNAQLRHCDTSTFPGNIPNFKVITFSIYIFPYFPCFLGEGWLGMASWKGGKERRSNNMGLERRCSYQSGFRRFSPRGFLCHGRWAVWRGCFQEYAVLVSTHVTLCTYSIPAGRGTNKPVLTNPLLFREIGRPSRPGIKEQLHSVSLGDERSTRSCSWNFWFEARISFHALTSMIKRTTKQEVSWPTRQTFYYITTLLGFITPLKVVWAYILRPSPYYIFRARGFILITKRSSSIWSKRILLAPCFCFIMLPCFGGSFNLAAL